MGVLITRRAVLAAAIGATWRSGAQTPERSRQWIAVAKQPLRPLQFSDRKGETIDLAAFQGSPILVNLWATWCAPCLLELPALDRLQGTPEFKKGFSVVPISVDRGGFDDIDLAYRRLKIRQLAAFQGRDAELTNRLGPEVLPATWLVSAAGSFVAVRWGRVDWDSTEERKRLRTLLATD